MPLGNWEGEESDEAKSGELPIYHLPFDLRAIGRDLYSFSHVAEKIFSLYADKQLEIRYAEYVLD
jgi:hypothetical protein|nr:MAG TPA: hypothetical protein [Caudoviricetes sp.]